MKRLLTGLLALALGFVTLHADRVFSTFDPATVGLSLKFDTNSVRTDNFFSPTILFTPDGKKCFVNFPGSDSVLVFDPHTMAVLATLAVGKNPALLAMTPDRSTITVANAHLAEKIPVNRQVGSISLIDVETLVVRTVPLEKVDFGLGSNIVFTPDGGTGFVSSTGTDEIVRFRASDGVEISPRLKLPVGSRPVSLTMARRGSFFTVINVADQQFSTTQDSVSIVDVATFAVRATITPKEAHDFLGYHRVTLTLDDNKGIIGDQASGASLEPDVVYIFDTNTGEILKRMELGVHTLFTSLTPDGSRFIVVDRLGISVISTDRLELVARLSPELAGFSEATNVVFTADSKTAYVASTSDNAVYSIDMEIYAITRQIAVGRSPADSPDSPLYVVLTPDEQRVAVLNFVSNTIDFLGKTVAFIVPRFYANATRFTGLALASVGTAPINVTLHAVSTVGTPFVNHELAPVTNPRSLDLDAGLQSVTTALEFFQNDISKNPIDGWISIDATHPDLIGSVVTGDHEGKKLAIVNLDKRSEFSFVIPIVRQDDTFTTELVVINPNFNTATVRIDLMDQEGNLVKSVPDTSLFGRAVLSRKLKGDSDAADFLPEAADLQGGYLVVSASLPVNVLAFYETADSLSALPGLPPSSLPVARGIQLTAPRVSLSGGYRTEVTLVNITAENADLVLTLIGNDGFPLTAPKIIAIAPTAATSVDLAELFGLAEGAPISAWLRVDSSNAGIVGAAEIFAFQGREVAAFPLVNTSGTEFHFADLAQGDGFATEIALVNPGAELARLTIDVFGTDGLLSASREVTLNAHQRLEGSLLSILGLASQFDGRMRVRSSVPVAGLAFLSQDDLEILSVVLPQTP